METTSLGRLINRIVALALLAVGCSAFGQGSSSITNWPTAVSIGPNDYMLGLAAGVSGRKYPQALFPIIQNSNNYVGTFSGILSNMSAYGTVYMNGILNVSTDAYFGGRMYGQNWLGISGKNTDITVTDLNAPAVAIINSQSTAGAAESLSFQTANSSSQVLEIAAVRGLGTSLTAGSESGDLSLQCIHSGSMFERLRLGSSGASTLSGSLSVSTSVSVGSILTIKSSSAAPTVTGTDSAIWNSNRVALYVTDVNGTKQLIILP